MKNRQGVLVSVGVVGVAVVLAGWAAPRPDGGELLSRHVTVAQLAERAPRRCRGLTSLCPDQCGESGPAVNFRIVKYLAYEKPGEYGDPQAEQYGFLLVDTMGNAKVPDAVRATAETLATNDVVLLSWDHVYVTREGSSWPERPIVKLEPLAAPGSSNWYAQVESAVHVIDAEGHGPDVGGEEWKQAVTRKLGILDAEGNGPTVGSGEWLQAVQRKAFGVTPRPGE